MKVTIFSLWRDSEPYINKALSQVEALEANNKEVEFEYYFYENDSQDNTKAILENFLKKYSNAIHIEYDPISYSAILDAHEVNYGKRILPQYDFEKADMILSLDADFLGTWLSPTQFTKDYRKNRNLEAKHIYLK